MTIGNYFQESAMSTINLKDARAGFSGLVDAAMKGKFITKTTKMSVIPTHAR